MSRAGRRGRVGTAPLQAVKAMLNDCAKGHTIEEKTHRIWVRYNSKTFHMRRGRKGERRPEIPITEIKAMAKLFGITKEAGRHFPRIK